MITKTFRKISCGILLSSVVAMPAFADSHSHGVMSEVDVKLSGWGRVEYGGGDRYDDPKGDDQFGISKMALVTEASYEEFTFVSVLGATILSGDDTTEDDIGFKDIFVVWDGIAGSEVQGIFGIQPILFGLKPNGYPGDRTIQPSIEFGGAGGFAVSNQGGAAARFVVPIHDGVDLELGAFDTSSNNAEFVSGMGTGNIDGSSIYKNGFAQIRLDGIGHEGLYAAGGIEGRYVGDSVDDTAGIYFAGAGFGNDMFDISGEWIMLDQDVTGTADDETYIVVELTVTPHDDWTFIVDWATADELDVDTLRAGVLYDINDHVEFRVEFAQDMMPDGVSDVESVDARMTFAF